MNALELMSTVDDDLVAGSLLVYYEAIERASLQMLQAAQRGDWDRVVKLEGACAVLISQLKNANHLHPLNASELHEKTRIMERILCNDAEIRTLAEPWLTDLGHAIGASTPDTMH